MNSDELLVRLPEVSDQAEKDNIEPDVVDCIPGGACTKTEIRKMTELERRLEELEQRSGLEVDTPQCGARPWSDDSTGSSHGWGLATSAGPSRSSRRAGGVMLIGSDVTGARFSPAPPPRMI